MNPGTMYRLNLKDCLPRLYLPFCLCSTVCLHTFKHMCRHINADFRQIAGYNQFSQTAAVKILRQKDKKIKSKVWCCASQDCELHDVEKCTVQYWNQTSYYAFDMSCPEHMQDWKQRNVLFKKNPDYKYICSFNFM